MAPLAPPGYATGCAILLVIGITDKYTARCSGNEANFQSAQQFRDDVRPRESRDLITYSYGKRQVLADSLSTAPLEEEVEA